MVASDLEHEIKIWGTISCRVPIDGTQTGLVCDVGARGQLFLSTSRSSIWKIYKIKKYASPQPPRRNVSLKSKKTAEPCPFSILFTIAAPR